MRIKLSIRVAGLMPYALAISAVMLALLHPPLRADEPADCLGCHTASADMPVHAVFNTAHAGLGGGGSAACTACHGASQSHADQPTEVAPTVSFGPRWPASARLRSESCQSCHQEGQQMLWTGSVHQQEELSCDNCHNAHFQRDPVSIPRQQPQVCFECHSRTRAEVNLPSRHPINEGKTTCSDCHNPHGSLGEASLHHPTLNQSCNSCHQEKRGPFLWEHPPVAEDCSLCHTPHGSVNDRLLTARGPALCQQCHSAAFHPSVAYGSGSIGNSRSGQNVVGKNCLNCHSQVHGSNHPSGARLTR